MIGRKSKRVEHHDRIGHGGENRAQPVFAVEALLHESNRRLNGALARGAREDRLGFLQNDIDQPKEFVPEPFLMRRLALADGVLRRREEQFVDAYACAVARARLERLQHEQGHQHGTAPIGNLRNMEGEPGRQQHDLHRHQWNGRPRQDAVERQQDAGEHVDVCRTAARADCLARLAHVGGVGIVADHLEREIGFHAGADVEGAPVKKRPAARSRLPAPQIDADLALELQIGVFAEIMGEQHVFGRNGRIGLQLEYPMAVGALRRAQCGRRRLDALIEQRGGRFFLFQRQIVRVTHCRSAS